MLFLIFLISVCNARVDRVEISFQKYLKGTRLLELPGLDIQDRIQTKINLTVFGPLKWRNLIHATTTPYAFSWVGWNFELALAPEGFLSFIKPFELYYEHHSEHRLDNAHPFGWFPVQDLVGIKYIWVNDSQ